MLAALGLAMAAVTGVRAAQYLHNTHLTVVGVVLVATLEMVVMGAATPQYLLTAHLELAEVVLAEVKAAMRVVALDHMVWVQVALIVRAMCPVLPVLMVLALTMEQERLQTLQAFLVAVDLFELFGLEIRVLSHLHLSILHPQALALQVAWFG